MKHWVLAAVLASATMLAGSYARAQAYVDARAARQQSRIHDAAMRGRLTADEFSALQHGQRHVARMQSRAARDGYLSPHERHQIAEAQDHESARIEQLSQRGRGE